VRGHTPALLDMVLPARRAFCCAGAPLEGRSQRPVVVASGVPQAYAPPPSTLPIAASGVAPGAPDGPAPPPFLATLTRHIEAALPPTDGACVFGLPARRDAIQRARAGAYTAAALAALREAGMWGEVSVEPAPPPSILKSVAGLLKTLLCMRPVSLRTTLARRYGIRTLTAWCQRGIGASCLWRMSVLVFWLPAAMIRS